MSHLFYAAVLNHAISGVAENVVRYLIVFTFCLITGSANAQTPGDSLNDLSDVISASKTNCQNLVVPHEFIKAKYNEEKNWYCFEPRHWAYTEKALRAAMHPTRPHRLPSDEKTEENEMLRMKLEIEQGRVRIQLLIISFAGLGLVTGALFIFVLYRSQKQICKRNKLVSKQNIDIQAQNKKIKSQREEIAMQSDQISLKNEFLIGQNQQLKESNLEKDWLISIVAHDLRTPLNQSKGFAELLKHSGVDADQLALVSMITRVNDDSLRLIQDLLQINALDHERLQLADVMLDNFIHDAIESTFKPLAKKKRIELHIAVEHELTVRTDQLYLKRILENLISNAIKFSFVGSSVFLRVLSSNESIYLSVEDQGPGISEEDQKKMFRKFQKLSARPTSGESSTGLGLAIVKGLVERLGGELKVKSQLGKGSSFIIRLNKNLSEIDSGIQDNDMQLEG